VKKIPSLFSRDVSDPSILTRVPHPFSAWVFAGEGVATRKYDGTAVRWADGKLWARYDAKRGKPLPPEFVPCQDPDPITGHHPGWVPATRPEDKWIREAASHGTRPDDKFIPVSTYYSCISDGTYEACGPRIGGNPEGFPSHVLVKHGIDVLVDAPRDWDGLVGYFTTFNIEGIVWWRDLNDVDCDKVKITGAALGIRRRGASKS